MQQNSQCFGHCSILIFKYHISFYIFLEPICPLFWRLNSPTKGLFQSKQQSFGFQVYTFPKTNIVCRCFSFSKGPFSGSSRQFSDGVAIYKKQKATNRKQQVVTQPTNPGSSLKPWKFIETSKIRMFFQQKSDVLFVFEPFLLPQPIQVCFVGHLTSAGLAG